jgi:hypothetical protein
VFVGLGVGMIAVAAANYLAASVDVAFVVLGAGLIALGGLAARIEGRVKLSLQGFEFALRARHALVEAQREVEERDPEEAKRLAGKVEELDDWFAEYQRVVAARRITNPFAQAATLQEMRQLRHGPMAQRGAATTPGSAGEPPRPGPGAATPP